MFQVVLFQPEIPPNTGNIIRLCANTGSRLHLIEPLGFSLDNARLRRAGLDYREWADVAVHRSFDAFLAATAPANLYALSSLHAVRYDKPRYRAGDTFLFGSESSGLPASLRIRIPESRRLTLPMVAGNRSVNLSNAVAVVVFEAWRQLGFEGAP
jgi:tRNA (cytidine/uridine-2'-O-)-methyltransferase